MATINAATATANPAVATSPPPIIIQQQSSSLGGPVIKVVIIAGVGLALYFWWSNTTLGQFSGLSLITKLTDPNQWKRSQKIAQESGKECGKQAKGLGKATCGVSSFFSSGLGGLIKTK